jgi:NodT family efflux transporter outer membrane factor (OMF) lipoprotein
MLALAATTLLAGCVGPDFQPPAAPDVTGYTAAPLPAETTSADVPAGEKQRFETGRDIPGEWWTLFHSEKLNGLIDQALKANPSLQAAQAALRVAHENVEAQRGAFFPTVQGSFDATRAKTPSPVSSTSTSTSPVYNLYTAQLSVSYTPDVWGGNWRQVESLEAQAEAERFQLEATQLTLASNVVAAAVNEAGLRGQIAAVSDIIAIERQLLDVLKRQNELGQVAEGDVVAQEAALAQAEQALPPLQKQLALQRDALAALVGRLPSREPGETFDLASLQLPADLPVSLPSKLVEQRPDIRQAEANLHAAGAQVGVAVANRLPLVNLTADMGSTASLLTGADNGFSPAKIGLFTPGTGFWTLGGSLTQTIFDGFTLMHRQRAAEAAYDQAEAEYRATVITAFQNVADTLHALEIDAEALRTAAAAAKSASQSLEITRRQLELGAVSYLALLNAQQTELQARINLVQAEAGRYADTAALFQALGGGWWNRPEAGRDKGS